MTGPLRAAALAPAPRTLVDVLMATVTAHPDSPAVDDTTAVLTYDELAAAARSVAEELGRAGIRPGDRVGVRAPSGTVDLYVAILGVLLAGAAYVPVDADDPQERADLVFGEAGVRVVIGARRRLRAVGNGSAVPAGRAAAAGSVTVDARHDAWVIFTSGSTGVPKGVAVTHRSAAAFVDAEARLFLQHEPIGPGDRVLAGLSVAFDASCEEMWLAWRHGACLVPAPRSLVRTGQDLGPWLVAQDITVVSTVPTLAALWPVEALESVRLLIFGGEACPPDLGARLATPDREVWNTYGPTEATVVACAARLDGAAPIRVGLPLDGWDLAVVGPDDQPVADGETGQLIIGGVGLARYLDPAKDAEKFAPMATLGWERAYRSGDLVVNDPQGLVFVGRADEQVKLGGRRIELGEVDAALQALSGVAAAAAAVRTTPAGGQVLVGYLVADDPEALDLARARERLREELPAALVPVLATVPAIPTRTSGKADRAALPWPLPGNDGAHGDAHGGGTLEGTQAWVAGHWSDVLGTSVTSADADFFALGGGSLSSARLVSLLRERYPTVTVADVHAHPRLGAQAELLESFAPAEGGPAGPMRTVRRIPRRTQLLQTLVSVVLLTVKGLQWLVGLAVATELLRATGEASWPRPVSWWALGVGILAFVTPVGRMGITALACRLLLRGLRPGSYPRGGAVQMRLWAAERFADAMGAVTMAGAPWIAYYARLLGATLGEGVDLHTVPPVTGLLRIGSGASIEPEVDLSGYWMDGDVVHVGTVHVGRDAVIGARSTVGPDVHIGRGAVVEAGSTVLASVPAGRVVAGSPARRVHDPVDLGYPREHAPRGPAWVVVYAVSGVLLSLLPFVAVTPALLLLARSLRGTSGVRDAAVTGLAWVPVVTVTGVVGLALLTVVLVRLLGIGLREGFHPVRSRVGWQVWFTERLLDQARTVLFPLYASLFTPVWLRLLGARVGRDVEASTVLLLPSMTTVASGAFLADDTMVASYEMARGWMHIAPVKIGKRSFLGNSGMTAPGRRVPKYGLVAVLSAAPPKSKAGSSWLGSPPVRLRRPPQGNDDERTFRPPLRLKVFRALVELCRIVPVMVTVAVALGVLLAMETLALRWGWLVTALLGGLVLSAAGVVAAAVTTVAKWVVVGRIPAVEHPLWSSFVWRNEVVDAFVEMVAGPWFAWTATGTPAINVWLRTLGARIGHGVWCETYWLPEADLVTLGDGATVNRGCVLQTHLFHDRIMSMDTVTLHEGATLGPHGVILPAASISAAATVGPGSLVLRGEEVPAGSRWTGNPIAPWREKQGA